MPRVVISKHSARQYVGMIYGAIVAWIALLIIAKVPVPGLGTVWPAIVVGVTVFFLVIVASNDLLSCVPANVYGYAALVGYTLSAGKLDALTAADNSNPLFLIVVSAILGAVLGYLMGQLAGVLNDLRREAALEPLTRGTVERESPDRGDRGLTDRRRAAN